MKQRTARRKAQRRYLSWLVERHPYGTAPPCLVRAYDKHARDYNRKANAHE